LQPCLFKYRNSHFLLFTDYFPCLPSIKTSCPPLTQPHPSISPQHHLLFSTLELRKATSTMSTLFLILLYILYLALDPMWIGIKCLILIMRNPKIVTSSIRNVLRKINNVLDKHLTRYERSSLQFPRAILTSIISVPDPAWKANLPQRNAQQRQTQTPTTLSRSQRISPKSHEENEILVKHA